MQIHISIVLLFSVALIAAEVTIARRGLYVYESTHKLRIPGTGFGVEAQHIILDLTVDGQALVADKHYTVIKDVDGDGLILKLLPNQK